MIVMVRRELARLLDYMCSKCRCVCLCEHLSKKRIEAKNGGDKRRERAEYVNISKEQKCKKLFKNAPTKITSLKNTNNPYSEHPLFGN